MRANLRMELLEDRSLPSATLINGLLDVRVQGPGTHTVSVDLVGGQVQVNEDGQISLFDRAAVQSLSVTGALNGRNVIQNNTNIDSTLTGGNLADTIFGGSGVNVIDPGRGPDTVYALLGQNSIRTKDGTPDDIFTNFGAAVDADRRDTVVRFFGPGRTPGTPFIGFDNTLNDNVLYITPSNNGSSVVINPGKTPGSVVVTYDLDLSDGIGVQTLTLKGVKAISYFGGSGSDSYVNNTAIKEAAYGSAGNDTLVGGFGELTVLKGSGGNDTLVGRARQNDLSGNGGADSITSLNPGSDVFRVDALDAVFGLGLNDVTITP